MDTDTLLKLGGYCEQALQSPDFQLLATDYEQELVGLLFNSKSNDTQAREQIFFRIQGFRDFLMRLGSIVEQRNKLLDPEQDHSDIDDPTVHDIYKGIFD